MNLEQIKNRQSGLNERLLKHLQESTMLLDYIAGENNEKEESIEYPQCSGLLSEISYQQDITERLIDKLYKNQQRMMGLTYSPNVAANSN